MIFRLENILCSYYPTWKNCNDFGMLDRFSLRKEPYPPALKLWYLLTHASNHNPFSSLSIASIFLKTDFNPKTLQYATRKAQPRWHLVWEKEVVFHRGKVNIDH